MAISMADALSRQKGSLDGAFLAHWTRARFLEHWDKSRYYRMLNKMLFHAAHPTKRYRIFEHFYRQPADLIGRFYSGDLTNHDKLKIVWGRPPVPIGKAIAAIAGYRGEGAA